MNQSFEEILMANFILDVTKELNAYCSLIVILVGLSGNLITIFVFSQKKFRTNSSNVYLLAMAIIDNLFLITHFFEDTIRTFESIGSDQNSTISGSFFIIKQLNIVNINDFMCKLISYFRYVTRFSSASLIVVFTLQRLYIVCMPLKQMFKSKKSAWLTVVLIMIASLCLNIWVPFMFSIQINENEIKYCDIIENLNENYFKINSIFIFVVIILPVVVVFLSNLLIIQKTKSAETNRLKLLESESIAYRRRRSRLTLKKNTSNQACSVLEKSSKKAVKTLIRVSFSYVFFDMPYLIVWLIYFCNHNFGKMNQVNDDYLFSFLKMTEVFYLMNFSVKFFIYSFSGSLFRKNLKSELFLKRN